MEQFWTCFDPLTGILWDTQIGLSFGDEINLVKSGFNSGYNKVDGIWLRGYNTGQTEKHVASLHPNGLADFGGKGKYNTPQFTWFQKVVPTGITFLSQTRWEEITKTICLFPMQKTEISTTLN